VVGTGACIGGGNMGMALVVGTVDATSVVVIGSWDRGHQWWASTGTPTEEEGSARAVSDG